MRAETSSQKLLLEAGGEGHQRQVPTSRKDSEGDAKQDGDGTARACWPPRLDVVAASLCVLLIVGVGVAACAYGPRRSLQQLFSRLPVRPGWGWYWGMGGLTLTSIVVLMPIWPPMCMASGLIFGTLQGSLLNFVAVAGAALVSLFLGHCVLRVPIRRCLIAGDYPRAQRFVRILENPACSLKFQILFRFLFIPMFIRNYVPSLLSVPAWQPMVACVPHSAWIGFLFASLGASFKDVAELVQHGQELDFSNGHPHWQQYLVVGVAMSMAIVLTVYAHMKYSEQLACEEAGESLAVSAQRGYAAAGHSEAAIGAGANAPSHASIIQRS